MRKLFIICIFASVFYFSTPAYSIFTKADYQACEIHSTPGFNTEKNLDGFTCAMWAKAIKNSKSVGEKFKQAQKGNYQIAQVEHSHSRKNFQTLELSFRTLLAASEYPKITVGKALEIIESCPEKDIDWKMLAQRITIDMSEFENFNKCGVINEPLIREGIESDPNLNYLLNNRRLIRDLKYTENFELTRLITEPVKLFPAFFNTAVNNWNLIEQRGTTQHQTEQMMQSLSSSKNLTVATFTENLYYAKKYLDMPINFEQIREIIQANSQQSLPPKQSNLTPPPQMASYTPNQTGTRKKVPKHFHPVHRPPPAHQPLPRCEKVDLLTDEGIYLFAIFLKRGYDLSSLRKPFHTLGLLGCKNADYKILTTEKIIQLILNFRIDYENRPKDAEQKIVDALKNDGRGDIQEEFTSFRPFLNSKVIRDCNKSKGSPLTDECIDIISPSLARSSDTFEEKNFVAMLFKLGMKFDECQGSITGKYYCESENIARLIKGWMQKNPQLATKEILITALNHIDRRDVTKKVNQYYTNKNIKLEQHKKTPHIDALAKYIAGFYLTVAQFLDFDTSRISRTIANKHATDEEKAKYLLLELIEDKQIALVNDADLSSLKETFSSCNPNQLVSKKTTLDAVLGAIPKDRPIKEGECGCALCFENLPNTAFGCCQNSSCKKCFKELFNRGASCPTCGQAIDLTNIAGFRLNTAQP